MFHHTCHNQNREQTKPLLWKKSSGRFGVDWSRVRISARTTRGTEKGAEKQASGWWRAEGDAWAAVIELCTEHLKFFALFCFLPCYGWIEYKGKTISTQELTFPQDQMPLFTYLYFHFLWSKFWSKALIRSLISNWLLHFAELCCFISRQYPMTHSYTSLTVWQKLLLSALWMTAFPPTLNSISNGTKWWMVLQDPKSLQGHFGSCSIMCSLEKRSPKTACIRG